MREIKFRAWNPDNPNAKHRMVKNPLHRCDPDGVLEKKEIYKNWILMQYTNLKDKNGKEIYEGDIVGKENVYHFIEREGWKPREGKWKIIGEKKEQFANGKPPEKYIAGYELKEVYWEEKSCGFEPFSDSQDNCRHCGGGVNSTQYEIIGNIYENPDLLNEI